MSKAIVVLWLVSRNTVYITSYRVSVCIAQRLWRGHLQYRERDTVYK